MSKCKHFWYMPQAPDSLEIECRLCGALLMAIDANGLVERAEKAEAELNRLKRAVAIGIRESSVLDSVGNDIECVIRDLYGPEAVTDNNVVEYFIKSNEEKP